MHAYELFVKRHLGKKIKSITYIDFKEEVEEVKRKRKPSLRKITRFMLLRCDCGFEEWKNLASLMQRMTVKRMCDSCLNIETRKDKELIARLKNTVLQDGDSLSKREYIDKYYSHDSLE